MTRTDCDLARKLLALLSKLAQQHAALDLLEPLLTSLVHRAIAKATRRGAKAATAEHETWKRTLVGGPGQTGEIHLLCGINAARRSLPLVNVRYLSLYR